MYNGDIISMPTNGNIPGMPRGLAFHVLALTLVMTLISVNNS